MAFDYKKEYKEYYMPKNTPQIVQVPKMNFLAVRGVGDRMRKAGHIKMQLDCCTGLLLLLK